MTTIGPQQRMLQHRAKDILNLIPRGQRANQPKDPKDEPQNTLKSFTSNLTSASSSRKTSRSGKKIQPPIMPRKASGPSAAAQGAKQCKCSLSKCAQERRKNAPRRDDHHYQPPPTPRRQPFQTPYAPNEPRSSILFLERSNWTTCYVMHQNQLRTIKFSQKKKPKPEPATLTSAPKLAARATSKWIELWSRRSSDTHCSICSFRSTWPRLHMQETYQAAKPDTTHREKAGPATRGRRQ